MAESLSLWESLDQGPGEGPGLWESLGPGEGLEQ
jgi:hypothetical protein